MGSGLHASTHACLPDPFWRNVSVAKRLSLPCQAHGRSREHAHLRTAAVCDIVCFSCGGTQWERPHDANGRCS